LVANIALCLNSIGSFLKGIGIVVLPLTVKIVKEDYHKV